MTAQYVIDCIGVTITYISSIPRASLTPLATAWSWITSYRVSPQQVSMTTFSNERRILVRLLSKYRSIQVGDVRLHNVDVPGYVDELFDSQDPTRFKTLFVAMWNSEPKMFVEMFRCLDADLCRFFGVDPSFKRLCINISQYLDEKAYTLFVFPDKDRPFIAEKTLTKAAWIIIGMWTLDGTEGLKRLASTLRDKQYSDAIECIRRERCRHLFDVPRIDYRLVEDGWVMSARRGDPLSSSLPVIHSRDGTISSSPSERVDGGTPSLHSSLLPQSPPTGEGSLP